MKCPKCNKSDYVIKYGKYKRTGDYTEKQEIQKYRCKKCRNIFFDENDYIKINGTEDIRMKLLGIILKLSDFDLSELNKFLGKAENSSLISLWEKEYLCCDLSEWRMPYMKSHSYAHHSYGINPKKENVTKWIEKGTTKKGIYIALNDDCSISYIDVFDETIK